MSILSRIDSPADLKRLAVSRLPALAAEIRETIVDVVSANGGHLASSLGVVELAIAIHYVFDAPRDKVIWDVGHQAYAHKLLTGRRDQFSTLRRYGGLSGFTRMGESEYDAFTTGHSSTSISAGLGMACGRSLKNDPGKVIAVIGDGSMTAGLAYEGLNQAGDMQKDLIVILNDNDMSISRNVGALSSFLSRTFSARKLQDLRRDFGEFLKSLPRIGDDMYGFAKRSEESFKTFVTPGMLFEAFNFDYFGPINGHRIDHLIDILSNIRTLKESVLLHVTTRKGKGYPHAEQNPVYFHGVGCFEKETGNCVARAASAPGYTQVFGDAMVAMAAGDDRIVAVTAAMPEGTGLVPFSETYPDRFFDVGIAEQHGVTFAAGLAAEGMKPVVAIYSTFLQRAYDQILHDVCIESLPVVFAIDRGGIVGEDGPTHHGLFDLSYLRCMPNMVVMAPRDEDQLRRMLRTAIDYNGPIALRYPRGAGRGVALTEPVTPIPIGRAEVLEEGDDLMLLGIGAGVAAAEAAAKLLRAEGIRPTVVDARFVKPLDAETLVPLARRLGRVVTIEENVRQGGFGSAVLEMLNDADSPADSPEAETTGAETAETGTTGAETTGTETMSAKMTAAPAPGAVRVRRVGVDDVFVAHGPQGLLRELHGLDGKGVAEVARALMGERRR